MRIPPISPRHPATSTSPSAGQFPPAQPRLLFLPRSGAYVSRPPPIAAPLSASEQRALSSSIPTTAQSMEFGQLVRKKSLVRPSLSASDRIESSPTPDPFDSLPDSRPSPGDALTPSRPRALSRISPPRVLPPTGTLSSRATSPPPTSR